MPFDWDERLSVGVEHIDVEHRQILRRVRHLAGAVIDGRPEEIHGSLRFLHGYLVEHFSHEEDWMAETGYPAAREHARHHAEMLDVVTSARLRAAEQPNALVRAAADLAAALDDHMRTEDLKLGRFVTARENLRALAEAGPGVGVALTPIPGSLAAVPRERDRESSSVTPPQPSAPAR